MIKKKLNKYILTNVLGMVSTSLYILADTIFISAKEGTNGITALNLVLPIYGMINAIGSMIGIGSAINYSIIRCVDKENANLYFANSINSILLISLIFVALGVFLPKQLLTMLGADEIILATGSTYTKIVLCFAPFFMLNYTMTAFVRNDNAPGIAMAATIVSGIFNIVFDYVFMFPLQMGMAGAALATGLSPVVSMLICLFHYLSSKNNIAFVMVLPSIKKLLAACKLGVVSFVGEISNAVTTLVFNFILLKLIGNKAVAAYGIIANIALIGTSLFNGVSQGLQPLASISHGTQNIKEKKVILLQSLKISIIIAILLILTIMLLSKNLVGIFNSKQSAELERYAGEGMRLYFLGFLFVSVNIVMAGFYSATGKAVQSSVIAICRGIIFISIFAMLFSYLFGIVGLWLSFLASETATFILIIILNLITNNRKHSTKMVEST